MSYDLDAAEYKIDVTVVTHPDDETKFVSISGTEAAIVLSRSLELLQCTAVRYEFFGSDENGEISHGLWSRDDGSTVDRSDAEALVIHSQGAGVMVAPEEVGYQLAEAIIAATYPGYDNGFGGGGSVAFILSEGFMKVETSSYHYDVSVNHHIPSACLVGVGA